MRKSPIPAAILVLAAIAMLDSWLIVVTTPSLPGRMGPNLDALGTDFMVFWGGARWFFEGRLGELFDGYRFTWYLDSVFRGVLSVPFAYRPWVYPPSYLLAMLPFGVLPFAASYAVFEAATAGVLGAALWFGAARRSGRGLVVGAALLGPAAAFTVGTGQNSFLTAALLIGGFRLLRERPALGGAMLGLLTIKPQFFLVAPAALVAMRQWRALRWSILAAAGLTLASLAVFGIDCWRHWFDLALGSFNNPQSRWVETSRIEGNSIYAALWTAGARGLVANAGQAAGTLLGIALAYRVCRGDFSETSKLAVLLAATMFAAPHSSLADMVLLASAAALWSGEAIRADTSLFKWSLGLAGWGGALLYTPLMCPPARLMPLFTLGFIAMVMVEARRKVAGRVGEGVAAAAAPATAAVIAEE